MFLHSKRFDHWKTIKKLPHLTFFFLSKLSFYWPADLAKRVPEESYVKEYETFLKIKKREFFRPFAPIVRLEDVSKYFNWAGESRSMSYSCTVKSKYKVQLHSVIHADKTSRVQTITREQNRFLYDLLSEMDKQNIVPVLINTSFNVQGKPILNSYKDAFHMLEQTALDHLIVINEYTKKDGALFSSRLRGVDF